MSIFHAHAKSYQDQELQAVYQQHENIKRTAYERRVLETEKASFTPLVYSTHGGMAEEATRFHKKVAQLISDKTKERYSQVLNCMRTKYPISLNLSFAT